MPPEGHGFAVLDFETTGLCPSWDRVVEVAIVRTDATGRVIDDWSTLLDPERPVRGTQIHGITSTSVRGAPRFADVAGEMVERLAGRVLVAHNAKFDLAFLRAELARMGYRMPDVPEVCTLEESRHYLPWLSRRRLGDCCLALGMTLRDAHSALADALATAGLLEAYLNGSTGVAPHAGYQPLLAAAAAVAWPPVPAPRNRPKLRPRPAEAPVPAPAGRLAALLEDLPLSEAVEDPASAQCIAYLELLAEVLEDRVLTNEEAEKLAALAAEYSVSREQARAAHRAFLLTLAHKAVEDGTVTKQEREDLNSVAGILGLDGRVVQQVLDEAKAAFDAAVNRTTKPVPPDWPHGEPLRVGMRVAFTGCDDVERARLEGQARACGLRVTSCVSSRTAMLVTDGTQPGTAKAVAARSYGTRTVTPEVFAEIVQYVQPALQAELPVAAKTLAPAAPEQRRAEPKPATVGITIDPSEVRAWARDQGLSIGTRGRIPAEVFDRYRAVHELRR